MSHQQQQSSTDEMFRVLACRQRRVLLQRLREAGGVLERTALVEQLDAEESADVAASLHHRDLPMLVDRGLVEYDAGEGVVTYRPNEFVEQLLTVSQSR